MDAAPVDHLEHCLLHTHAHDGKCGCPPKPHGHVDSCRTCRKGFGPGHRRLTLQEQGWLASGALVLVDTQVDWCSPDCLRLDLAAMQALKDHEEMLVAHRAGDVSDDEIRHSRFRLRMAMGRVDRKAGEDAIGHDIRADLADGLLLGDPVSVAA